MLLMIDNYDSFTFNLVQYLGELGQEVRVVRNDTLDIAGIRALNPSHIMISPGPGTPDDAGCASCRRKFRSLASASVIRRLVRRSAAG